MPSPAEPNPHGQGAGGRGRALREAGPYIGLGTTLAATVLAGLGVGYWLDERLGTAPWLLLAGGTLGVGAGSVYMFKLMLEFSKRQGRKR